MLATTGLKRSGASAASTRSLEMQTAAASMFAAKSFELQLVDEQLKSGKFDSPHHYAVLFIDGKSVSKPGHKTPMPSPRWPSFHFNISSTLRVAIFRKRRLHKDSLVAQYTGKGRDFLDRDTKYVLTDETGSQTGLRLSINIDLTSIPPADFIKSVTDNAAGLQSVGTSTTPQALGGLGLQIFQILEKIVPAIDKIADAHPVLQMTWTILSSVYKAVKDQMVQDAAVCDLATSLQEILGVANICPELVRIEDTEDIITEIRRAALEGAMLIAEYVGTTSLAGRTAKHQLSDMSDRITQCQKRYTDLGGKFNRRVQLEIRATVKETHATVKEADARVKGIQDVQMEREIKIWMSAPDTSPNFNAARKKHQPDTGSWFLDGPAFTRWKEEPDIILWLHGGPGCGKTILGAAAIQAVIDFCNSKASTGYAYFFFDARSAEAALLGHEKLVRSIIMQLAHRCDGIPVALAEMHAKCDKGSRQPPIELLEATFLRIVDSFDDVYIVIDSLDECSERKELLAWIRSMTSSASGKLHMMATSRSEPDIRRGLQAVVDLEEISVIGSAIKADISTFLDTKLAAIDDWDEPGLKELVKDSLLDGSDGMFRWAALQLDELLECVSREELELQLKSLPKGLDETYARILSRSARPKHLKMFLQCLAFSRRAMTVHELAEVATVEFTASKLPAYNGRLRYTDPSKVVNICYGLVTEVDGIIKLAHFSVKEYLISENILSGTAAQFHVTEALSHSTIAQICLAYLLHFDKPGSLSEENLPLFPLAQYAAEHWVAHFHSAGSDHGNSPSLQQLQLHIFELVPSYVMRHWLRLYDEDTEEEVDFDREDEDFWPPLYYACRSGATAAVANLINEGADVNDDRAYLAPLQVASQEGHFEIVELLLTQGADVGAGSGEYLGTALQRAALHGHLAIVQLLLSHGADANEPEEPVWGHALSGASSQGYFEIVQLLLVHGAAVNATGGRNKGPALFQASDGGYLAIVQLLLAHGAHVNAISGDDDTALGQASSRGHVAIVKLLWEHGAVEVEQYSSSAYSSSSADVDSGVGSTLEESAGEEGEEGEE